MKIFAVFEEGEEDAVDYFQFEEAAAALVDHLTDIRPEASCWIEIIEVKAAFDPEDYSDE